MIKFHLYKPPNRLVYLRPFVLFTSIYIGIAFLRFLLFPPTLPSHFVYLADSWLHGHLYLSSAPANTLDYTWHDGHWYVAFPPLPAILLLPFVAMSHLSNQILVTFAFSVSIGLVNIGLMSRVFHLFFEKMGKLGPPISWHILLFSFGTEHLMATMQGNAWYLAHLVATTFLLLYITETFTQQRPILAGLYLGLAALSRITTLLAFPLFLFQISATHLTSSKEPLQVRSQHPLQILLLFSVPLCVFGIGMLLYNFARFGSLFDFGYNTMNVNPLLQEILHEYGQFNLHFIPTNLRYMLFDPPRLLSRFPYLSFSPFGTGIFWTTPSLLFAFFAFRHKKHFLTTLSLISSCILIIIVLLLYFNTGWYQFGYRFSMDFLPFGLILSSIGMYKLKDTYAKIAIGFAVGINVWGCFVFAFSHPL